MNARAGLTLAHRAYKGTQAWHSNCPDIRGLGHVGATLKIHWRGEFPSEVFLPP